jgi:hypothetical protein
MKNAVDMIFGNNGENVGKKIECGRYDVVIEDIEYSEKVVKYNQEFHEMGISGREFMSLNPSEQKLVLDRPAELSSANNTLPKVDDILHIYVREPESGVIMKWRNGISIRLPHWPRKDRETGEVKNPNDFVTAGAAWPSRDLFDFIRAVTGKEAPRKGFKLSDYISKGFAFNVEIDIDEKGYAKVVRGSWRQAGDVDIFPDEPVASTPDRGDAEVLLQVLRENKDMINGKSGAQIAMTLIPALIDSNKIPFGYDRAIAAWSQVKITVLDENKNAAL